MHRDVEIKKWSQISGFFDLEEVTVLQSLAKDMVCLEIGSFYGRSTIALAEVAAIVYAVDTFKASGSGAFQEKEFTVLEDFITNTKGWGNIWAKIGRSEDKVPLLPDGQIGLVFIDGSHEYEDVKRDIDVCWPKLIVGGFMAFHDYGSWAGVTKAVDERGWEIAGPFGTLVYTKKEGK